MAITIAQGAQALNETLNKMGYEYQIDTTDANTIETGFRTVGAYPPALRNNILDMQMLILRQRAYTSMFTESKNPTRAFWRDAIDFGGGERDTFLKLIDAEDGYWAEDFTGDESGDDAKALQVAKDLVKFKKDDVINKIHTITDKFRVKMSMSDLEYTKVFTPEGYANFIDAKYANFQQSAEAHLMDIAIRVIKQMVTDGNVVFKGGLNPNTTNGVTTIVETLNATSDGMQTLSTIYNKDGVRTTTEFSDIYFVTTPELYNRIKSRGYANAFNLREYENKNRLIMLPAGTDLGKDANEVSIGALLMDRRAVMLAVKYWEVMPFIVSNTDYRNTFLKVQLVTGYTEFFNAVAFATGEVGNFTEGDGVSYIIKDHTTPNIPINVNGVSLDSLTPTLTYLDNKIYEVCNNSLVEVEDPTSSTHIEYTPYGANTTVIDAAVDYFDFDFTINGVLKIQACQ